MSWESSRGAGSLIVDRIEPAQVDAGRYFDDKRDSPVSLTPVVYTEYIEVGHTIVRTQEEMAEMECPFPPEPDDE